VSATDGISGEDAAETGSAVAAGAENGTDAAAAGAGTGADAAAARAGPNVGAVAARAVTDFDAVAVAAGKAGSIGASVQAKDAGETPLP